MVTPAVKVDKSCPVGQAALAGAATTSEERAAPLSRPAARKALRVLDVSLFIWGEEVMGVNG
jgi:hypothetical protein